MHTSSSYSFSISLLPLVVSTIYEGYGPADLEPMFEDWREIFARKERFVALCDLTRVKSMPSAKQRARTGELSKSIEADSIRYSLGSAMVVSNAVARGAMTAIDWINPPKVPQTYVGTVLDGCDWCIGRIREVGLPVPGAIVEYRSDLALGGKERAPRNRSASGR